jgi:large subunit ribosomal protein L17
VVKKLFDQVSPAFKNRKGGYTRIMRLGTRPGDVSKMALIEYLSEDLAKVLPTQSDKTGDAKKVVKKKPTAKKEAKKAPVDKKVKAEKAPAEKKTKVSKKEVEVKA